MIKLGYTNIGKFTVWITAEDASVGLNSNYFLVLLTESQYLKDSQVKYYVNLLKSKDFTHIFNVDKDYRPTKLSDMTQYNHYMDHREIQMPLWKLSKHNVEELLKTCQQLTIA